MIARAAATALLLVLLPCAPASAADRDRDRMPDAWERRHHLTKPGKDADRDGLTNVREHRARTHPRRRDSDRDGLRDGDEIRFGWHPRKRDSDRDGIRDGRENAGVVVAVDGSRVTIRLAVRGRLRGVLEDPQALSCDAVAVAPGESAGTAEQGPAGDDPIPAGDEPEFWDPAWGEMPADLNGDVDEDEAPPLARAAQAGDPEGEEEAEDEAEDVAAEEAEEAEVYEDCSAALRPGALVHEATSELGAGGRRITRLRLVA